MSFGNKINKLHQIKYDLFKEQNPEIGRYDVIFEVEGKLLYAHKLMLTLVSDTFNSMLSDRWTTKDEPIKIKDYSYNDFYQFVTFLYTAKCELTDTNIYSMVDIAEFYGVELFKECCDEYFVGMKVTAKNVFKMMKFANKYSMAQLKTTTNEYVTNNFRALTDSDGFLKVNKSFINDLVHGVKDKIKPEDLFQAVYKWCEKRAAVKQAAKPNLNLNDAIKAEISDFLPYINFSSMEMKFMVQFLVPRGFIFSSLDELSKLMNDRLLNSKSSVLKEPMVKVTNDLGQTLHGNISDKSVIENIKYLKSINCSSGIQAICYWIPKFKRPSTPSPLKKKDGVKWYLLYFHDGFLGVFKHLYIDESYYLLAELTAGASGFDTAKGCKIEIE